MYNLSINPRANDCGNAMAVNSQPAATCDARSPTSQFTIYAHAQQQPQKHRDCRRCSQLLCVFVCVCVAQSTAAQRTPEIVPCIARKPLNGMHSALAFIYLHDDRTQPSQETTRTKIKKKQPNLKSYVSRTRCDWGGGGGIQAAKITRTNEREPPTRATRCDVK